MTNSELLAQLANDDLTDEEWFEIAHQAEDKGLITLSEEGYKILDNEPGEDSKEEALEESINNVAPQLAPLDASWFAANNPFTQTTTEPSSIMEETALAQQESTPTGKLNARMVAAAGGDPTTGEVDMDAYNNIKKLAANKAAAARSGKNLSKRADKAMTNWKAGRNLSDADKEGLFKTWFNKKGQLRPQFEDLANKYSLPQKEDGSYDYSPFATEKTAKRIKDLDRLAALNSLMKSDDYSFDEINERLSRSPTEISRSPTDQLKAGAYSTDEQNNIIAPNENNAWSEEDSLVTDDDGLMDLSNVDQTPIPDDPDLPPIPHTGQREPGKIPVKEDPRFAKYLPGALDTEKEQEDIIDPIEDVEISSHSKQDKPSAVSINKSQGKNFATLIAKQGGAEKARMLLQAKKSGMMSDEEMNLGLNEALKNQHATNSVKGHELDPVIEGAKAASDIEHNATRLGVR